MKYIDMTGKKYGKLTVLYYVFTKNRKAFFNCKCECGNICTISGTNLRTGKTKSCGCLQKLKANEIIKNVNTSGKRGVYIKHGFRYKKIYKHWCKMKSRCYNKNSDNFKYYGGRGITVCEEWKNSFTKFKEWAMQNGYKDNLTLDRIDVNGNYEPSNCRWVNFTYQIRNRRNTIKIIYNNEVKPLSEWCEKYNINYKLAYSRYKKNWSFEKIFEL